MRADRSVEHGRSRRAQEGLLREVQRKERDIEDLRARVERRRLALPCYFALILTLPIASRTHGV